MTSRSAVRLGDALALERHAARRPVHRELDVRALDVRARQLGRLQPLDFLAARRAPGSTRVPAEKRAMKSFSCAIFFSRCALSDSMRDADLRLGHDHVVVAAGVGDDRLVVDVGDVRADRVEEVAVVRDDDQRAVVADQEVAQPVDRVEVEVVGRLVEQQRLRLAEQRLREQHADLLAALQLAPSSARAARRGCRGRASRMAASLSARVAVLFADDALELAEAHAVLVGHVGLRVEPLALLERRPQALRCP